MKGEAWTSRDTMSVLAIMGCALPLALITRAGAGGLFLITCLVFPPIASLIARGRALLFGCIANACVVFWLAVCTFVDEAQLGGHFPPSEYLAAFAVLAGIGVVSALVTSFPVYLLQRRQCP